MSCNTCNHYKPPRRLGNDRVVGEKGKCGFGEIQRPVEPNESCCMDTSFGRTAIALAEGTK